MKTSPSQNVTISGSASASTPSAERGGGAYKRLAAFLGAFTAKAAPAAIPEPTPEARPEPVRPALETILLPHARTRWLLPAAASLTPAAIESILKEALTGKSPRREQELYSLMESTWPRLLKNTTEVKDAVLGLDWNLMDAAEDERLPGAEELVKRCKNGMKGDPETDGNGWRATLSALLDAKFRGISISEIEWEYRGGKKFPPAWLPKLTRDLPAWHYGWRTGPAGSSAASTGVQSQNDGRLVLYPDGTPNNGIHFPPNKFLIAISKAGKGHPSGTALLRCLAWFWCASNFSQEWLLNFAQIFGQPFRWATYDASQEGVKEALGTMMEQMGSAAWGIGPDGTKIEWHEASKSGADNPQSHILTLADTACDLLVLGQTLTGSVSKEGGSRALGDVHQSVRADIIDSTALWLAEVLNEQLIPMVVTLNLGDIDEDGGLPWFQPARKNQKDTKVLAETFKIILDAGIPVMKEEIYDALDLSMPGPEDEEKLFGGVPASAGVSGAILTALTSAGLRITDAGIASLSSQTGLQLERIPASDLPIQNPSSNLQNPDLPDLPAEDPQTLRRLLAKLPLDAREYVIARLAQD